MSAIVPLERTDTTVTLTLADYRSLLGQAEDARDLRAIRQDEAARAQLGESEYRRLCYTEVEMRRMVEDDVSPIVIWRERLGMTQRQLAAAAATSPSYLAEVEGGKKPGSAAALLRIAKALQVPMEHLVEDR